jgi:hypothetical protein
LLLAQQATWSSLLTAHTHAHHRTHSPSPPPTLSALSHPFYKRGESQVCLLTAPTQKEFRAKVAARNIAALNKVRKLMRANEKKKPATTENADVALDAPVR